MFHRNIRHWQEILLHVSKWQGVGPTDPASQPLEIIPFLYLYIFPVCILQRLQRCARRLRSDLAGNYTWHPVSSGMYNYWQALAACWRQDAVFPFATVVDLVLHSSASWTQCGAPGARCHRAGDHLQQEEPINSARLYKPAFANVQPGFSTSSSSSLSFSSSPYLFSKLLWQISACMRNQIPGTALHGSAQVAGANTCQRIDGTGDLEPFSTVLFSLVTCHLVSYVSFPNENRWRQDAKNTLNSCVQG